MKLIGAGGSGVEIGAAGSGAAPRGDSAGTVDGVAVGVGASLIIGAAGVTPSSACIRSSSEDCCSESSRTIGWITLSPRFRGRGVENGAVG